MLDEAHQLLFLLLGVFPDCPIIIANGFKDPTNAVREQVTAEGSRRNRGNVMIASPLFIFKHREDQSP